MLSFQFTPEQDELRRLIRAFVTRNADLATQKHWDEVAEFPEQYWGMMAEIGLPGVCVSRDYGGTSGSVVDQTLVVDELASTWMTLAEAYVASTYAGVKTLEWLGTEEQKRELLPRFVAGEIKFAFGITEPDGGTDVLGALRTKAVRDGSDWIINGAKVYTTIANIADYIVVVARTSSDPKRKANGITVFLVPRDAEGVQVQRLPTIGLKTTPTNLTFYQDVRVPASSVLGEVDRGWYGLLASLNNERIITAALALGNARAAFEYALDYSQDRHVFGKPLASVQAMQHYLAEMLTLIEASHLMVYKAAALQDMGEPCGLEATMAKMYAADSGFRVTTLGMKMLGGAGFTQNLPMQRYFRDSHIFTVAPIANEMARNYIAEELGLERSF